MEQEQNTLGLSHAEQRVLGCLLEKEMATPEYYPLTLNALQNACNQKTNREPVVGYDEETVLSAVNRLKEEGLVRQSNLGRAVKFEQIISDKLQLTPREKGIICILLLRGPQTIGEIRGRTERLYSFQELTEVRETLDHLMENDLVTRLPVQPGRKEARYVHLLGDPPAEPLHGGDPQGEHIPSPEATIGSIQLAALQEQVTQLHNELAELRKEFSSFKAQFD